MSLFQKSVEKKYLNELDSVLIDKKYKEFQDYFGNPSIQENIRNSKEEQFQEEFLRELLVSIFGNTLNPHPTFNLTTELKNIANSKKADGAILKGEDTVLNSALMSYYFMKNTAKSVRKMFPKVILKDLRLFPFKEIDETGQA